MRMMNDDYGNCGVDDDGQCPELKEPLTVHGLRQQAEFEEPSVLVSFSLDQGDGDVKVNSGSDRSEAEAFISILAGDEPVTFQTFADSKDIQIQHSLTRILHGTLEQHAQELTALNEMGAGIFVMVNQGDGGGRSTENVTRVRAVFVDLDVAPLDPTLEAPLRPHLITETSPGRFHVYWLVRGIPLDEFSFFQQEMAHRLGGDQNVKDLPRVMRVPGFLHLKGEPFLSRIFEVRSDEPYSREQFVKAFSIDLTPRPSGNGSKPSRDQGSFQNLLPFEHARHKTMVSIAGLLTRNGHSAEEMEEALLALNRGAFGVPEDEKEVRYQARDIAKRYAPTVDDYIWSEAGLTEQFVKMHGVDCRYCKDLGGWLVWDGQKWARDTKQRALQLVKKTIRNLVTNVQAMPMTDDNNKNHLKFLIRSETAARFQAILAISQPDLAVSADEFDKDRYLLNVQNGTLDLRTGQLRDHRREDYLTKIGDTSYDPQAKCDLFESFLDTIFDGDQKLISYIKRVLGYCLTGDTSEQIWFMFYGTGANGKTTLMRTVQHVMGDYGLQTPADTFLLKKFGEGIRNDLARLRGARLVAASEPPSSGQLNAELIKYKGRLKTATKVGAV